MRRFTFKPEDHRMSVLMLEYTSGRFFKLRLRLRVAMLTCHRAGHACAHCHWQWLLRRTRRRRREHL